MRSMRNVMINISLVFLVFAASPLFGAQVNDYQDFKFERLAKVAAKEGSIRVIVKMHVPDLEPLTVASTNFKSGFYKDKSYVQSAAEVDIALDSAISRVREAMLHRLNGKPYILNRTFSSIPFVAMTVFPETLEKLKTVPMVVDIFEDRLNRVPGRNMENSGDNIDKPSLDDSVPIVGADTAWNLGYTGQGWYVAVLDSGLRTSHEMFRGKNIVEQCYSLGADWYDRENGDCPNGRTEMSGPGSAAPYAPQYGHGTHVTGIATGNNGVDRFGVAKGAGVIAVQVFSYIPAWGDIGSYDSDALKGLDYVYSIRNDYNIASVNMSLGSVDSYGSFCGDARSGVINNLRAAGIATVVASGNESQCNAVAAPGCVEGAVTVTGSDKTGNEYTSGNWHDAMVDLVAPGTAIESSVAFSDTSYSAYWGTSMSTPHVAGAWAIIKQFDPNLSVDEIVQVLQESGTQIYSNRCPERLPKPQINVGNALNFLFSVAPPLNVTAEQMRNRSLLQTEYINVLTWERNPRNEGRNIVRYKIYLYENQQLNLLGEVNSSTFQFWHRHAGRRVERAYGVSSVNDEGNESSPYYYTIEFGNIQE